MKSSSLRSRSLSRLASKTLRTCVALPFVASLAGCAADVMDESAAYEEESTTSTESEVTAGTTTAAPKLDAEEYAFVAAFNAWRAEKGLPKVGVSIGLTQAAMEHSNEMAAHDYFSHQTWGSADDPDFDLYDRVIGRYDFFHYDYDPTAPTSGVGEDLVKNHATGAAAVEALKAELGTGFGYFTDGSHGKNPLNTDWRAIGVARAKSAAGVWYWTITYGAHGGKNAPMLSTSATSSILSNGGFETDSFGKGNWDKIATWYAPQDAPLDVTGYPKDTCYPWDGCDIDDPRILKWHRFASTNGAVKRGTSYKKADSYGLRIVDPDPGGAAATQVLHAMPGVNYEASVRARRNSGSSTQKLRLHFLDDHFNKICTANSGGECTKYATVSANAPTAFGNSATVVKGTAPAGTRYVRVILGSASSGTKSSYDFDSVKVKAW